ncbi:PTS fructose transporter subunit IIB, partial [Escherichia sp. SS-MK2]
MSKKLIALCACPMGLAHTFMAAQALEEAAVEAGYEVKIETQGADGIQNRLTAQDIAEATIIIHSVAVTPEAAFRGLRILNCRCRTGCARHNGCTA